MNSHAAVQHLDGYPNQPEIVAFEMSDLDQVELQALEAAGRGESAAELGTNQQAWPEAAQANRTVVRVWLVLVFLFGLGLIAISCNGPVSLPEMEQAQAAQVKASNTAIARPSQTPAPAVTATPNYAAQTLAVVQAELGMLAVENTRIAQDVAIAQATQAGQMTATEASAISAEKTLAVQSTATAAIVASKTAWAITATPLRATQSALDAQVSLDGQDYQFRQSLIVVRRGWEVGEPILLFVLVAGIVIFLVKNGWKLFEQKISQPMPAQQEKIDPLRIEVAENDGRTLKEYEFKLPVGVEMEMLRQMAKAVVYDGWKLTHEDMTMGEAKIFTRDQFRDVQYEMVRCRYACWKNASNPASGMYLFSIGRRWLEHLAGKAPCPAAEVAQEGA